MIDTHTHLGRLLSDDPGLKPSQLLRWMDRQGIEKALVMAVESPEEVDCFVTSRDLLRMTKRHRDRLFPLCAVDPRHRYPGKFEPLPIIAYYMDQGCVGYGENLCGLTVDDPMQQRVYEACDRLKLAMVMHFDSWINRDKPGLPGFERMLATYRNVNFIGHSPNFWKEISPRPSPNIPFPGGSVRLRGKDRRTIKQVHQSLCGSISRVRVQRDHARSGVRFLIPQTMEASDAVRHRYS